MRIPWLLAILVFTANVNSAAYRWKNVQIVAGGFITGIVAHPLEKDLFYLRTDIGGAYRWNPVTKSWISLTDWISRTNANYIGIESIGLDPSDPNRLYLAAGTYTESWSSNGAILVSNDRGNTFQTVPLPIKLGANDNGRQAGERLAVDPNQGSIIYFGSRLNGLWKSNDHGFTWAQVSSFPVKGPTTGKGVGVVFVNFVARSGTKGGATPVIYAGVSDTGTNLYRSEDAGATWQPVPNQPTGLYPNHGVFGPDGNLYITYGNDVGPNGMHTGGVFKCSPSKDTWTNITPPVPSYENNGSYGFGIVAIDQQHPGTIIVSSMDLWYRHDDIWRSTNGGVTWETPEIGGNSTFDPSAAPYMKQLQLDKDNRHDNPGWWIGAMLIDPFNSSHVMYGTGANLWITDNADSRKGVHWQVGGVGIEEVAVLQLISPPSGAPLVSAVGDICGFVHNTLTESPPAGMMSNPTFGTTTGLDFAQKAPGIIARVGESGNAKQLGAISTDGGGKWKPFAAQPLTKKGGGTIAVSSNGATLVWAPSDAPVSFSQDLGKTWAPSSGAPSNHPVLADRINPEKFYIFDSGKLYSSTDSGKTFQVINKTLPNQGRLAVSFTTEGDLWLASDKGLYHSTDSGAAFTALPNVQQAYNVGFGIEAIYLHGQIDGKQGFYRSIDNGRKWTRINDDAHQYGNATVIIGDQQTPGRVYIGTNGRGIIVGEPE